MDKDEIKNWLAQIGKDRAWLAAQVGCTLGTLNQWFSKLGFPDWAQKSIQRLMHPQGDTAGLEVVFTAAEFELIEKARQLTGHPTRAAYYHDAIVSLTERILKGEGTKDQAPAVIHGAFEKPSASGDQKSA